MVGFGEKIAAEAYPPWEEQYLSYGQLKLQIDQILAVKPADGHGDSAGVYEARKHIFQVPPGRLSCQEGRTFCCMQPACAMLTAPAARLHRRRRRHSC